MYRETGEDPETCAYRRRVFARRGLGALLAVVLSACGSGDDTAPEPPTQEPAPTAVAGEPIPLGCEPAVPATRVRRPAASSSAAGFG